MDRLEPQLNRIDLSTNSRNTLAALIELLSPHVPRSLSILGTILNTIPRTNTLQSLIDPSKVSLWTTIPLRSDAVFTTSSCALFSVVTFSHIDNHQFRFFCSGESNISALPTEAEEMHVKRVFEHVRDIASEARPTYDAFNVSFAPGDTRRRTDTDPPMIIVGAVHAKWAHVLAPMSAAQNPQVRHVFRNGVFAPLPEIQKTVRRDGDDCQEVDVEVSQIRASDLPFVYDASSIPRSDVYILSRAPYSVCLRSRQEGQPIACALMHSDGSIGALRVDPRYQRQGFGRIVIRMLMEKLSKGQGDPGLASDGHQDLGGGALGWNWVDTGTRNETANRFFTSISMCGERCEPWMCHWMYIMLNSPDL